MSTLVTSETKELRTHRRKVGIVQHAMTNDLPLGCNVDEPLRMLEALQFTEKHGAVCPANWKASGEDMKPTAEGVVSYLVKHAE